MSIKTSLCLPPTLATAIKSRAKKNCVAPATMIRLLLQQALRDSVTLD